MYLGFRVCWLISMLRFVFLWVIGVSFKIIFPWYLDTMCFSKVFGHPWCWSSYHLSLILIGYQLVSVDSRRHISVSGAALSILGDLTEGLPLGMPDSRVFLCKSDKQNLHWILLFFFHFLGDQCSMSSPTKYMLNSTNSRQGYVDTFASFSRRWRMFWPQHMFWPTFSTCFAVVRLCWAWFHASPWLRLCCAKCNYRPFSAGSWAGGTGNLAARLEFPSPKQWNCTVTLICCLRYLRPATSLEILQG